MQRGLAEICRANDKVSLAYLGFKGEAEFLISRKGIDDLHDGLGFEVDLIQHYGSRRGREDTPPLPVGVVGCGEVRKGRVFIVDEKAHGSGLVGEVNRAPETGEKCGVLALADGGFDRRVENAPSLRERGLGFAEGGCDQYAFGIDVGSGRNNPDAPGVFGGASGEGQCSQSRFANACEGDLDFAGRMAGSEGDIQGGKRAFGDQALGRAEFPFCGNGGEWLLREVGELDFTSEGFVARVDALGHADERHDGGGHLAKRSGIGDAFGIPEGIEETHMRRALARVVVEVEELVACERMTAQGEFDFLFVKLGGEFARDASKVWRLCKKAVLFQVVLNGFQIDRAEDAFVFRDLREVGKNIPLADLVGE